MSLGPFLFFALFPFYFMVITSFKANGELYNLQANPFIIHLSPEHPQYSGGLTLEHYRLLLRQTPFLTWLFNSRGDTFYWGSLMAGAILILIPIVLVYVVFIDYYVSSLTQGAIK
jgi:ABC-type glycerol-3-phosphate transport system permease component